MEDQPLSTFGNTISQLWFLIDAAKVGIFYQSAKHFPCFLIFHGKWQANELHRMANGTIFRAKPRIAASEGGNSGRFSSKIHYLFTRNAHKQGISGLAARKIALPPASAAPTALRFGGNCLPLHSGICKDFLPVAIARLCRSRPCVEADGVPPIRGRVDYTKMKRIPRRWYPFQGCLER